MPKTRKELEKELETKLKLKELTDKHARAVEQNDRTRARLITHAIKEAQNKLNKLAGR